MIKQTATGWSFVRGDFTTEEFLNTIANIGYAGVEMIDTDYWSLAFDLGLVLATIGGHNSLIDGLNKRENHDWIEDEIFANIEVAVTNKIPNLICFSGNRYDGLTDEAGIEITAEGLSRVAKAAEENNVTLVLELLNSKVDHPQYQCDRTAWGVAVCQKVNSSHVKLLYDIYHMQIMEGDLIRTISQNINFIGHFHTAGNPGRNNLDDNQEIYYPPVIKAIVENGYNGYTGHEFIAQGDPVEALQQAYNLCQMSC
ncbi:MAG: TIM barrel protein [Candidatus Poribacteria bacterium]|jgi:hydroxypyruvate isomerase